jgi:hypothetical protein
MNLITRTKHRTIVEAVVLALAIIILASCDFRSGIAKEEAENFNGTPTPSVSPTPTLAPIDPADIVQVDTSQNGEDLIFNQRQLQLKKPVACTKYDEVNINIESATVTIQGVCRQITINGDNNKITADAAMRFVINGVGNNIGYLKFPNGQRPSVTDNGDGNIIEKISADALVNKQLNGNRIK